MSNIDPSVPAVRDVLKDCEYLDGADLPDGDGYVPEEDQEKVDAYLGRAAEILRDFPDARHLLKADSWRRNREGLIRATALILNEVRRLDRIHATAEEDE